MESQATNLNSTYKSSANTLTLNQLYIIFGFLSFKDVFISSSVCKNWKKASEKYFKSLRSYTIQTTADVRMYLVIAPIAELQEFSLSSNESVPLSDVLRLFDFVKPTVKSLRINYATDETRFISYIFLSLSKAFPSTESIRYFGKTINEIDIASLKDFPHLKQLYILDDCYFEGRYFNSLNPLEAFVIHSHMVRFEYISGLLTSSIKSLRKITLDLEDYEEQEIDSLIEILKECKLSSIDFKYCNNLNGDHLVALRDQYMLRKLSLRKTFYVGGDSYARFFENKFPELQKLRLAMNNGIDSHALTNVAKACENLRILDITWCEQVDARGIYEVLLRCPNLETLSIVGVKKANEAAFPVIKEYYEEKKTVKIPIWSEEVKEKVRKELCDIRHEKFGMNPKFSFYQKLKYVDATKCDFIPDEVFLLILLINPTAELKNYYDEIVSFPIYQKEITYN